MDIEHRKEHGRRLAALKWLFAPETHRKPTREEKDRANQRDREKRQREREVKSQTFGILPDRPLLPCGEDCENCPYDKCPYTDADLDALEAEAKREKARRQSAEKYQRQKARMAVDPVYAEKFRAGNRRRNKEAYARNPEKYRKKSRDWQKKKRQQQKKG